MTHGEGGGTIIDLGLWPAIVAFVVVELVALAIPPLRRLRGDPLGRVRLGQLAAIVTIVFALADGSVTARAWESFDATEDYGMRARLLGAATLACGTLVLVWLAGMIREHGLGNGYGALLVAGALIEGPAAVFDADLPPTPWLGDVLGVAALVVIAALTAAVLRWRIGDPADERAPALRMPASGIAALSGAGGLAVLIGLLVGLGLGAAADEPSRWVLGVKADHRLAVGLVAALAVGWSYLLARPSLVAAVAGAAGLPAPTWGAWGRATLASAALLLAVYALAEVAIAAEAAAARLADPIPVMLGTAVVLDIIGDARAHRRRLEPAGVLHQIQHAAVVERVLADAGIPCHLHASHLRSLLAFFGPYAPVIVLVPEPHAAEARLLLEGVIAAASGRGRAGEPG
jgi:hypothetical protein